MVFVTLGFALFGFLAFVRTEKLIKNLKGKGLLDDDYKADWLPSMFIRKLGAAITVE